LSWRSSTSMRNFNEVSKELNGFVNLCDTIANKDILDKFRRRNKLFSTTRRQYHMEQLLIKMQG
jgi:hypothetical protein